MRISAYLRSLSILAAIVTCTIAAQPASAVTFVVTKTADTNDGTCDADCSLREAIVAANASMGADEIDFNIPASDPGRNATTGVFTIEVSTMLGALPSIVQPTTIDGYSQGTISTPGDPTDDARPNTNPLSAGLNTRILIELRGNAGETVVPGNGLTFTDSAASSEVRGLAIGGFNTGAAIFIDGADGMVIEGNFLGARADGATANRNTYGLRVAGAGSTRIGGGTPATSNLISGNVQGGVLITDIVTVAENRNSIQNNLIGTNSLGFLSLPAGEGAAGADKGGVLIIDAGGVLVGGAGFGNVISGNSGIGILMKESASVPAFAGSVAVNASESDIGNNIVQGNRIGTTADGSAALGNNGDAIEIVAAQANTIGGTEAGQGNTIASSVNANGIAILGDAVVVDAVTGGTSNENLIVGNTITGNGMDGVLVVSGTGNRITANSIFANTQQGIDLLGDGITPNDTGDPDPAASPNPNNLQNFPVLTVATAGTATTNIQGTLNSEANKAYRVEFFANTAADDGGNGEGQTFLGAQDVTTDGSGNAALNFETAVLVPTGQFVTATATNADGDTSEFSNALAVTGKGTLAFSAATYTVNEPDGSATITVTRSGPTTGTATVNYATSDGSATDGSDYTATSGTLTFGDDVTSQTFSVPVLNDTAFESDETVNLTLTNVTGSADLANPSTATLTIVSDDAEPTPTASPTPTATPSPTASPSPSPSPSPAEAQLLNISTRGRIDPGENVMIGGFIVGGNAQKDVIVRAIGPSLDVNNALQDPVLQLHGPDGSLILRNDNWKETQQQQIEESGIAPEDDRESAIRIRLAPGNYTAVVTGNGSSSGVGLVEIYDLDRAADSRLANISTRARVRTEESVLIAGFMLGGNNAPTRVVLRGIGPSLTQRGVANALSDPILDLRNANGTRVAFNDNWQDDAAQAAELSASGLAPEQPAEAALAATLPPGEHTAILAGKDDATGVGLVEVYDVP